MDVGKNSDIQIRFLRPEIPLSERAIDDSAATVIRTRRSTVLANCSLSKSASSVVPSSSSAPASSSLCAMVFNAPFGSSRGSVSIRFAFASFFSTARNTFGSVVKPCTMRSRFVNRNNATGVFAGSLFSNESMCRRASIWFCGVVFRASSRSTVGGTSKPSKDLRLESAPCTSSRESGAPAGAAGAAEFTGLPINSNVAIFCSASRPSTIRNSSGLRSVTALPRESIATTSIVTSRVLALSR